MHDDSELPSISEEMKMNVTAIYPNNQYGILQIENAVGFVVLSVTLTASVIDHFYAHVGILDNSSNISSRMEQMDICTEDITNGTNNFKIFYCTDWQPRMTQMIFFSGLSSDSGANVST